MNPAAILALIGELYEQNAAANAQIQRLSSENDTLRAQLEEAPAPAAMDDPTV
jgi:hypothetical protein